MISWAVPGKPQAKATLWINSPSLFFWDAGGFALGVSMLSQCVALSGSAQGQPLSPALLSHKSQFSWKP